MYLEEDGLSDREREEFSRHRSTCPQCAAVFARLEQSRSVIHRLAATVPALSDPHNVALNIMKSIAPGMKSKQRLRNSLFNSMVDWLVLPHVRAGMALLLLVAVLSFILEYSSAFFRLKEFEERIAIAEQGESSRAGMGIGRDQLVQGVLDLSRLLSVDRSFTALGSDWVMVKRSSLKSMMLLFNELNATASQIPPEFQREYPELSTLLLQNGASFPVEELRGNRDELLRELNTLISTERKMP